MEYEQHKTLAIVAVLTAATLVLGGTLTAATTTQSAFAYSQKKKGDENSRNGNIITIQKCKQAASESGFDNNQGQECENLICTHPGENATCTEEGVTTPTSTPSTTPVNKMTCEECFRAILTQDQIDAVIRTLRVSGVTSLADVCSLLERSLFSEDLFRGTLIIAGIGSDTIQTELIQCLKDAGIHFRTSTTISTTLIPTPL